MSTVVDIILVFLGGILLCYVALMVLVFRWDPEKKLSSRRPESSKDEATIASKGKNMLETFIGMLKGADRTQASSPAANPPVQPRIETDPDMQGLPENARPVIRTINALMTQIEHRIEGDPLGIPLVVEMTQMRDIHLPRLCRSYVEIPEAHRRDIYARTGKSASFHLLESLRAMEDRLMEIDKALAQSHIATFEQNADIIRNTYGRNDNPLG